jgi:DNA-binding transcriptional LysR family regulator
MDLDLRRLRYFVAVAERLHFRRAAEELHVTQPALSRQIASLERDLGVTLLTRDKRSVALTAAGRQLLADAHPLLAAADAARRRAQRAERGSRRLVIGFRAGIVPTGAIRAFAETEPEVAVSVRRLEWDDQEDLIRSGLVDVGYVRAPVDERGLRLVALLSEPRLAALPAGHPLAAAAELTEADLAGERRLRYLESPADGSTGPRLRSVEEKLEHVAAGSGIILLPRSATRYYTRPDVVYVPVSDAEPDRIWLATESARRSRTINRFIAAAQGEAQSAVGAELEGP